MLNPKPAREGFGPIVIGQKSPLFGEVFLLEKTLLSIPKVELKMSEREYFDFEPSPYMRGYFKQEDFAKASRLVAHELPTTYWEGWSMALDIRRLRRLQIAFNEIYLRPYDKNNPESNLSILIEEVISNLRRLQEKLDRGESIRE